VQRIVIANSALHFANATKLDRLALDEQQGPTLRAYKDALVAKHNALLLLSEALGNRHSMNSDFVLASIMLFIEFELLDSSTKEWRFHVEGARQLMVYLQQNGQPASSTLGNLRNCLVYNCVA
jgi:hypothetical protein